MTREKGPLVFDLTNQSETSLSRQLIQNRVQSQIARSRLEVVEVRENTINIALEPEASIKVPIRLGVKFDFIEDHHLRDNPFLALIA